MRKRWLGMLGASPTGHAPAIRSGHCAQTRHHCCETGCPTWLRFAADPWASFCGVAAYLRTAIGNAAALKFHCPPAMGHAGKLRVPCLVGRTLWNCPCQGISIRLHSGCVLTKRQLRRGRKGEGWHGPHECSPVRRSAFSYPLLASGALALSLERLSSALPRVQLRWPQLRLQPLLSFSRQRCEFHRRQTQTIS